MDQQNNDFPPPPVFRQPPAMAQAEPPKKKGCSTGAWIALIVFGFIGLFMMMIMGMAMLSVAVGGGGGTAHLLQEEHLQGSGADKVAVVDVKGVIGDFGGFFGGTGMVDKTIRMLRAAANDASVKAVILRVDTPGGGVTASDEIYNEIKKLKEKKPVVVHMGDLCASGGVYIAAPCTSLVASPTTLTGSIGVIISHADMSKLYEEKLGIKSEPIKSGKHKDILSTDRQMTPEERALIQSIVDEMYERFLRIVAEGRAGKGPVPKEIEAAKTYLRTFADGRIFTGEAALKNGLVDRVGYFEDAINEAETLAGIRNASVFRYKQLGGLLAALSEGMYGGSSQSLMQAQALQELQTPRLEYRFRMPGTPDLSGLAPLLVK